jgi:hypothetical protein
MRVLKDIQARKKKPRAPHTWGSIFRKALRRGDDHGYAAFLADAWEKRQQRKKNALVQSSSKQSHP